MDGIYRMLGSTHTADLEREARARRLAAAVRPEKPAVARDRRAALLPKLAVLIPRRLALLRR
jgi:hypothetical protein